MRVGVAMHITPLAVIVALAAMPALAHVNESMDYTSYRDNTGTPCCDDRDCRPADDFVDVRERGLVRLKIEDQWIDVPRAVVVGEDARDGRAHWCGGGPFTNSHPPWVPFPPCRSLPPPAS